MKNQQRIRLIWTCMGLALLTCCVSAANPEKHDSQTNTVYQLNQSKIYKIMVPKGGYLGSPLSPFTPRIKYRQPTSEAHFKPFYVRVTIVADRKHKGHQRIVLRLDEADENMKILNQGLYYSYVDFLPEGLKILTRCVDDNGNSNDDITVNEIPFPFDCARPLQLGFKSGSCDGHRDEIGYGVKYLKKERKDDSPVVNIEAVRFRNLEGIADTNGIKSVADRPAKWYTAEVDDVLKSKETTILYRENQKWASESDWLWDEMERFDKDGNILMKCKKIQ